MAGSASKPAAALAHVNVLIVTDSYIRGPKAQSVDHMRIRTCDEMRIESVCWLCSVIGRNCLGVCQPTSGWGRRCRVNSMPYAPPLPLPVPASMPEVDASIVGLDLSGLGLLSSEEENSNQLLKFTVRHPPHCLTHARWSLQAVSSKRGKYGSAVHPAARSQLFRRATLNDILRCHIAGQKWRLPSSSLMLRA